MSERTAASLWGYSFLGIAYLSKRMSLSLQRNPSFGARNTVIFYLECRQASFHFTNPAGCIQYIRNLTFHRSAALP